MYNNGAICRNSEEMIMRMNIAIDGPVGAGKSSVSDAVAKKMGILHLDTGAMYRALGLTALRKGIDTGDEENRRPVPGAEDRRAP